MWCEACDNDLPGDDASWWCDDCSKGGELIEFEEPVLDYDGSGPETELVERWVGRGPVCVNCCRCSVAGIAPASITSAWPVDLDDDLSL